jgi:tetratricopeptide (TPR) repeat protein
MPPTDRGNLAYMLALLLVEHGRNEEGLEWMAQAATALPGNARIRYNQGLLLSRLNRRDEALQALRSGLAQSPDDADLLYSLIYLHALAGRRDAAFGYVQRMRERRRTIRACRPSSLTGGKRRRCFGILRLRARQLRLLDRKRRQGAGMWTLMNRSRHCKRRSPSRCSARPAPFTR